MFSICKSESTKSSRRLLALEPLKHSIAERTMAKDTYPGNCAWVTFSLPICDQLRKSAVVLNTLIRHSACGRENQGSERSLFDLHYSFGILPLLLVLIIPVDLLRSQVSVRVCVRVTHPNIEKCRSLSRSQKPLAWISKRASEALLPPWFNVSPVTSWRNTGSTSTSLHH